MARARFRYAPEAWENLIIANALTTAQIGRATGISERQIANILAGVSDSARLRTVKKIRDGLGTLGITSDEIDGLFLLA